MTKTEMQLLAVHRSPVVLLSDICERYLGWNAQTARLKAAKHSLPFPAFQPEDGNKRSPWMVRVADLAEFLDACAEDGAKRWAHSQL